MHDKMPKEGARAKLDSTLEQVDVDKARRDSKRVLINKVPA